MPIGFGYQQPWPALAALVAAIIWTPAPVEAQVLFDQPRQFRLTTACEAFTSFRKRSHPVALKSGTVHPALGENKSTGATQAYLDLDGERKWLSLDCGRYETAPSADLSGNRQPRGECLAFFDDLDNPERLAGAASGDLTPPPPGLSAFEQTVNSTCGIPGKQVTHSEFRTLFQTHAEVLEALRSFTAGRVFAGRSPPASAARYLDDLTDAWMAAGGFEHIFCGEPKTDGSIGGLHFRGRYLDLQRRGLACRMPDNRVHQEVVPGSIYTLGVMIPLEDGVAREHAKSYGLTLSAEDIFKLATRALVENPTRSHRSEGCLLTVMDDTTPLHSVFVRRRQGIRTFYPEASPNFGRNPRCAAAITVPHPGN